MTGQVIDRFGKVLVVRDDLFVGGTKARVLPSLLNAGTEYVYASPACGYAQLALAIAAKSVGATATIFTASRATPHDRTLDAQAAGARIEYVRPGYLSVVQARARGYCKTSGATLLPFGMDWPEMVASIARCAASLDIRPREVWTVAGSGTLTRGLQAAWPDAKFYAVQVGAVPNAGNAEVFVAGESFDKPAKMPPPFPSCENYDAKAWKFIEERAQHDALFWNVAA